MPCPLVFALLWLPPPDTDWAALFAAAPGAASIVEQLEAELPDPTDEILLDSMPISIYGGG